jgi:2-polyprenyl-3-methyl-5-hydroxy-6-metoxy-1,4-benzoquinol methylase
MRRIPPDLLREMAALATADDAAEMAIPSYLHPRAPLREMAWRRVEVLASRLAAAARSRRDLRIVDFGCGSGVLFEEASRYAERIWGVDIVLAPARHHISKRGYGKITLLTPDEAKATIPPGSVDVILAGEVLEHVEPLAPTLDLFAEWLLPSRGKLLVTLPTESALYRFGRKLAGFSGHYHHANALTIDAEMRERGWERSHLSKIPLGGPFAIYWCADYSLSASSIGRRGA